MKVFCDCGAECIPTQNEDGELTFEFPVAKIFMMGLVRYELRAIWFACPDCENSFMLLPFTSTIDRNKAVVETNEI